MSEITITRNEADDRYEAHVGDALAGFAQYRQNGDVLDVFHTEVDDAFGGQGIGSRLVAGLVEDAQRRGLKVLPTCPFVATWFDRHPDFADVRA